MKFKEKYNAALSRARKLHSETEFDYEKGMIEEIFPELKENESERIRKVLIDYFQAYKEKEERGITTFNGIPTDNILAWLEKQGEKKSMWTDNDRTMAFTLLRDVDQMTYISDEGKNERLQWLNSLEDKFNNGE